MNKALAIVALTALVLLGAAIRTRTRTLAASSSQMEAPCVSYVPREWGQYKGGSAQTGLAFEDSIGTLRFVTNLPCGAVPIVALEVRRPAPKN